jgi:hypothetical protein
MPSINEIVTHAQLFLDKRMSADDFGDWMLRYTGNIMYEGGADDATRKLAYTLQERMTIFGIERLDEETLRQELARIIQPFSSP